MTGFPVRKVLATALLAGMVLAGTSLAHAGCSFAATPLSDTAAPRADVTIEVSCLHDASGAALAGKTVSITVARPGGSTDSFSGKTDESGGLTVVDSNTHEIGAYAISAASGLASASSGFAIIPGNPAGAFQVLASDACLASTPAPTETISVLGVKDAAGNPTWAPETATLTITAPDIQTAPAPATAVVLTPATVFTRTVDVTTPASSTDSALSSWSAIFDFKKTDETIYAPAGTWTVKVTQGAATATGTFQVLASVPSPTPAAITLAAPTTATSPGKPATIKATVKDGAGAAAPCVPVTFSATPAGGSAAVTTVTTDATGVATLVNVRTDAYGATAVSATAGSQSASGSYTVAPGDISSLVADATPSLAVAGSTVVASADRLADAAGNPITSAAASLSSIRLFVRGPDGSATDVAPAFTFASNRTGRSIGTQSVTADQTGNWIVEAYVGDDTVLQGLAPVASDAGADTAAQILNDPVTMWNVDLAGLFVFIFESSGFTVVDSLPTESGGSAVRDLSVTTVDPAASGQTASVTIGNLPAGTDSVSITVTKPGGGTYADSTGTIVDGAATFTVPGSETGDTGIYQVTATSSASAVANGTGSGSFSLA